LSYQDRLLPGQVNNGRGFQAAGSGIQEQIHRADECLGHLVRVAEVGLTVQACARADDRRVEFSQQGLANRIIRLSLAKILGQSILPESKTPTTLEPSPTMGPDGVVSKEPSGKSEAVEKPVIAFAEAVKDSDHFQRITPVGDHPKYAYSKIG
jgi:hypothetical protein